MYLHFEKHVKNISKILFFALLFILISINLCSLCLAAEHVVISEVLYDPINSETGGEALELYNPMNSDIDISGWTIATENSAADATIPANSIIKAHGFFLIADAGWSAAKDNAEWPDADYEEALTLANYDAGIILKNGNLTIDAVGWGNASGISEGFFEGTPAIDVAEGHSIERKPGFLNPLAGNGIDTDNNSQDFIDRQSPEPQSSFSPIEDSGIEEGTEISINFKVFSAELIKSIYLSDEDETVEGIQISPNPGNIKTLTIIVNTTKNATVSGNISTPSKQDINFTGTQKEHIGVFDMDYYNAPGNYTVNIKACADTCENQSLEFYYQPILAMSLDTSAIDFSSTTPGTYSEMPGDFDFSTTNKATLWNTGNTKLNIKITGTNFISGSSVIPINSLRYSFDNDFESELSGNVAYSAVQVALGLLPSHLTTLGFRLSIPENAAEGSYFGSVILMATE